MAVDPQLFEREMPEEVRAVLQQGRAGQGLAVEWLVPYRSRQVDASLTLWRTGPPLIAGWLAGIAMFDDSKRVIAGSIDRERLYDPIPFLLDAFAAGIRAGAKPSKHHWGSIERLVVRNLMVSHRVPPPSQAFLSLLPLAVCTESAITREHAVRIAGILGEPAHELLTEARARATEPRDLARIDAALGTFTAAPNDAPVVCALLDRLLVEWRACRDPALELPIQRLGRMIATIRGPLRTERKATSYYELEGIWQRRAHTRDPGDLDRLLDIPLPWFGDALARIEELAKHPPDPRLARLLDVCAASERGSEQLVDVLARRMAAHFASPRLVSRLDTIDRVRPDLAFATTLIRDAIPTPGRAAEPALLAEAHAATQERAALEGLLAQVARQPKDLALRAVVADALETAGDPRGEFIGLQLAIANGAADRKLHKRATLLLDAHFATWTADLPGLARAGSRFERGFLSAARFEGPAHALALSLDAPSWRTVERLNVVGKHELGDVIRQTPLLRAVSCGRAEEIEQLAASGPHPQLRAIGTEWEAWWPADRQAFPALAVIGGTSWQHGEPDELRAAMRRAVALGLEAFVWFDPSPQHVLDCFDGSLELRFSVTSGRGGGFAPDGFAVRIPRAGAVQIAWLGSPDHTNLRFELTTLVTAAHRLGRGPVEVYLAPDVEHRVEILAQLAGFYSIAEGGPVDLAG